MKVFQKENHEYKNYMNPVDDYIKQMSKMVSIKYSLTEEQATEMVKKAIKAKGPVNRKIKYRERNEYGDRSVEESSILSYLAQVRKEKNIISPSFTVYTHPDKEESILGFFTLENVAERSKFKKKMFEAERQGNSTEETFYNFQQNSKKTENNGLSGAFASDGTCLYNPSSHYTLTSTTRCVSGIGNAISESIVGGNKYFRTVNSIYGYLGAILTHGNLDAIQEVMTKYNLKYPTTEDIKKNISLCTRWYWKKDKSIKKLLDLIDKLTPVQKAAFLYINDLWSFKELNDSFLREMFTKLSTKVTEGSTDPLTDLNNEIDGTNVLVHHIFASEIKGLDINYKKLLEANDPLLYRLASTAKVIKETLYKYSDFFKAFLVTEILPPNIQYIKSMLRFNIVLSDTDSTCCSYGKWVTWFFGENRFDDAGIGMSAAIMTITTQIMSHYLKVFSKNINFGNKKEYRLDMKNEYMWPVFVTSDLSKHYFATTMIREGNVFKKNKLEKKGVHYISSTFGADVTQASENMMLEIMDKVSKGEKIYLSEYVERVANFEKKMLKDIDNGELYMYKKDSIKSAKAYKQEEDKSKYVNHTLWMEVFAPQYGAIDNPPYAIYNVTLNINNKTDWGNMLENIGKTHPELVERLVKFCDKNNKNEIKTLRIPKMIADANGIPKPFIPYIDGKSIVIMTLKSLYLVLSTLGFYVPEDTMVCEVLQKGEIKDVQQ